MASSSLEFKQESLEFVMRYFRRQTETSPENYKTLESNIFKNSSTETLLPITDWLENQFNNKILKNNVISSKYRKEGNTFYSKKNLEQCLDYYTKSLCYAVPHSEEYCLAIVNRSAVSYEMERYDVCLKDIEICLNCSYPQNLIPKIYLRKAQCLHMLGKRDTLKEFMKEIDSYISSNVIQGNYVDKLSCIREVMVSMTVEKKISNIYSIPNFENGENPNFASASTKIEIRYTSKKGRHVVAKQNISQGDLLFVEKAFIFGPIFNETTRELDRRQCYNCLEDIMCGIPCNSCIQCVYCDANCRDISWNKCHQWECPGMQTNMWYHLGIVFPAFKTLLEGIKTIFNEHLIDEKCFGDKEDNYPYFDSLVFHTRENDVDTLISCAVVISYLINYTDFFQWYSSQSYCIDKNISSLSNHLGKRLFKHVLQLENNSSVIEHWIDENGCSLPSQKKPVACGIFPSVSIMNHSCKPNITNYFIGNTIVVKALENIIENKEVFNCYGIDYRMMQKEERQELCLNLYNFKCDCTVCSDPRLEMETFNAFLCPHCGYKVPDDECQRLSRCEQCGTKVDLNHFREMNRSADQFEDETNENSLLTCLDRRKVILYEGHPDLQTIYQKIFEFHTREENFFKLIDYFEKWYESEEKTIGNNNYKLGHILHQIGSTLLQAPITNLSATNREILILKAQYFLKKAKNICQLYYSKYFIDRIKWS